MEVVVVEAAAVEGDKLSGLRVANQVSEDSDGINLRTFLKTTIE